jgi:hypothetical protein
MDSKDSLPMIRFNAKNFNVWRYQMKLVFEAKELLTVMDGSW